MRRDKLMQLLESKNISTYYLIPLLRITPDQLGGANNILNSYISRDHKRLIISISSPSIVSTHKLGPHTVIEQDTETYYVFTIPKKFSRDVKLFMQGKYSRFSSKTKNLIRRYSNLVDGDVMESDFGELKTTTSIWLLALDRKPAVRKMWEEILYSDPDTETEFTEDTEVLSIPDEDKIYLASELTYD